ncbi:MAG: MbcA/ParS/Xre antitoxin family protein [Rhodospirillales bacterium]|nr:MbcA/ParS/Xre antitoxin family protein [Rhodospirillales bacterium]
MSQPQAIPAPLAAGPPPAADLADPAARARLTPAAIDAVIRLADLWRLTGTETCQLLGDVSERSWFRMKKGDWTGALSQDALTRVSALIGIFKGLRLLFSLPLADEWVRLPNQGPLFGGQRPLDLMLKGGIPAMLEVRQHIDALRGGL